MSESMNQQIKEITEYYKNQSGDQEQLLEMLREIQEVCGQLSPAILEFTAKELGLKPSFLSCLVKYSPTLKLYAWEHQITVCTGQCCAKKGSLELLNTLRQELRPDKNGISGDKKILLTTRCCLKHCKSAPNLLVDGELISNVTGKQLPDLLRKLH